MKVYDLTHTLSNDMPIWAGSPVPNFHTIGDCNNGDKFQLTTIKELVCHVGTHIDCDSHQCPNGFYTDTQDVNYWVGKGLVLDVTSYPEGAEMGMEVFDGVDLDGVEYILVYSGWSSRWSDPTSFYGNYAVFSLEVMQFLAKHPTVRGLCVETNSVDIYGVQGDDSEIRHKNFLWNKTTITECLNLECAKELIGKNFLYVGAPLKIKHGEGSPTRALAIVLDD